MRVAIQLFLIFVTLGCENRNSKEDREHELYFSSGELALKGNLRDGNKVGLWEEFYPSGQLYRRVNYDSELEKYPKRRQQFSNEGNLEYDSSLERIGNGHYLYLENQYFDNGEIEYEEKVEIIIDDIDEVGLIREEFSSLKKFRLNGKLVWERRFKNDVLKEQDWYDEDGSFVGKLVYTGGEIEMHFDK